MKFGVGQPVPRKEDPRLVTGGGRFTDDVNLPSQLYLLPLVESSGGGTQEEARITLHEDGSVEVVVGTYSHGQGHRTMLSQIFAEVLGVGFDDVNVVQGDTKYVKFGGEPLNQTLRYDRESGTQQRSGRERYR
ncbi:MAG: molybdopterin-dependent oxidoreductase [Gammaproteobacteria bacterium]|nr:molybdopterin-dependent oxidoreductase [Gammaproteobacteria bacterium]